MGRVKKNPQYKNYCVSVVSEGIIETYGVIDIMGNEVEYEKGFLPLSDARILVDQGTGGLHYIYNLDLPAKVEAENLRQLRRSTAIKNIFTYDVDKSFDIFKLIPYIIILFMVMFGN